MLLSHSRYDSPEEATISSKGMSGRMMMRKYDVNHHGEISVALPQVGGGMQRMIMSFSRVPVAAATRSDILESLCSTV